ncbi:tyrosine-type recombinase/integrase [Aeoliella mucimassa]|uniref:Site-specific tyrosine recombinase XerD n=1 Tax=Aeoliella mucimassa TaxID=2527972 RepID=A0A518AN53_9BACT|nr:site-specific integrase [Aeoliella mucimassa]QDU56165.1 site-specific tyrosine recombinase XerD [Aeoliella mucimassa]
MPKLVQSVPKYRKHRASGQAVVTLCGVDHYLGPHGTKVSKTEYDRLVAEWLANGRAIEVAVEEITVLELVVAFLKYAKRYYGGGTRGSYANLKRGMEPLKRLYSRTNAAEFGPREFKAVRQTLIDEDLSRKYINEKMRQIIQAFTWAAGEAMIPPTVPQSLKMVTPLRLGRSSVRETEAIKPVAKPLVDATLKHLSPTVSAMVQLQMLTGARPGEICVLRPCDVDRSRDIWVAKLPKHKTAHHGRERVLLIGPKGQEVLRPYLLRPAEDYCFSPAEAMKHRHDVAHANRTTPMSCGNSPGTNRKRKPARKPGRRYITQSYARAIQRACEDNGLEHWSPNQLRHLTATEVRREFGLEAAQIILGHSQANVTQVYAERDIAKGIEVAKQIG